jgi:hypothetical protein
LAVCVRTTAFNAYILQVTKAKLLFVHPGSLNTALAAAKKVGLSADRVVLFLEAKQTTSVGNFLNIDILVRGEFIPFIFIIVTPILTF